MYNIHVYILYMTYEIYKICVFYAHSPRRSLAPKLFLDHVKAMGWPWRARGVVADSAMAGLLCERPQLRFSFWSGLGHQDHQVLITLFADFGKPQVHGCRPRAIRSD